MKKQIKLNLMLIIFFWLLAACSFAVCNTNSCETNVKQCGAVGDGKTDDTKAFLRAIEIAEQGSHNVYVPFGTYIISKPLVLKNLVMTGPAGAAWPADVEALPVLIPTHRDGPAIHLFAAGALRGMCIRYKWGKEPTNGPPAVLISGVGAFVSNVKIGSAWDGIITDGNNNVGRLNIENVFMVGIKKTGVRVSGTWDVSMLRNIEIWNPNKAANEESTGFLLGKNDLIRLADCIVYAMTHGFVFIDDIDGCKIKGGTWGTMSNCATDYCGWGLEFYGRHTLSISGGTFWNHQDCIYLDGNARVRIAAAELKSNGAPAISVKNCDHLIVNGCSIIRTMKRFQPPTVELQGGRTVMRGNYIDSYGPVFSIGKKTDAAFISGNMISVTNFPILAHPAPVSSQIVFSKNIICSPRPELKLKKGERKRYKIKNKNAVYENKSYHQIK